MNKLNSIFCTLGLVGLLTSACTSPAVEETSSTETIPTKEHTIQSVLWLQNSAEYRALSYQAFNIASLRIEALQASSDKPLAIITDVDETVLDNSLYSGMQIQEDLDYTKETWVEWGKLKKAEALPGAVQFFNLADSLGIEVFYISNRYNVQLGETIENLKELNLPYADSSHVLLRTTSSEKQERRNSVLENYEVALYMGDNLSDFSSVFDNQNTASRNQSADELSESFGDKFIVFPNPMYGDWESKGIYENNRSWTNEQRDSIRHAKIRSYK